jgi:hypothetical protein
LTGAQIIQFLSAGFNSENITKSPKALRGRKMGLPHVAGMTVYYDPTDLAKIEVYVGSKPLDKNQKYIVAATDFELSDIAGYLVIPDEQVEYEVPTIMPEVLEAYVMKYSPIQKPIGGRITIKSS